VGSAPNWKSPPVDIDSITVLPSEILSFVSTNQDYYARVVERMQEKSEGFKVLVRSWCWGACFFPLNWLLYRRLWTSAAGYIFVTMVFAYLLPKATLPAYLLFGLYAKGMYVSYAARTIRKIAVLNPNAAQAALEIPNAGGVSPVAAWIIGIIEVLLLGLAIYVGIASGASTHPHVIYYVPK
jgi:hypothetical protein